VREPGPAPRRTVVNADAIAWLQDGRQDFAGCSFVTSLPDVSELSLSLADWKRWFVEAAALVMRCCPEEGVAIFFQTDIKKEGVWVDKGLLCQKAAEQGSMRQLFHKIVCRRPPGTVTFGRPAYAHLLAFAKRLEIDPSRSSADVLADGGPVAWTRGMGTEACALACRFVREQTRCTTVVDPFCGQGTVLAVANSLGLSAIGVELCRKRARHAQHLSLQSLETKMKTRTR
jgi:hypothetical protein